MDPVLDAKLDAICVRLDSIEKHAHKMSEHIDFIHKIYLRYQNGLDFIHGMFNKGKNDQKSNLNDNS